MNKAEAIAAQLAKPIEVGDLVDLRIPYLVSTHTGGTKKAPVMTDVITYKNVSMVRIVAIKENGFIEVKDAHNSAPSRCLVGGVETNMPASHFHISWATQSTFYCGPNPFKPSPRIDFLAITIESLLYYAGVGKRSDDWSDDRTVISSSHTTVAAIGKTYGGVNFDPYVIDKDGYRQYYQRGLVWNEDQKKLLLDSIYAGIEIGKFVFRERNWEQIEKEAAEDGNGYNFDCVDGKQRLNAIIGFVRNEFTDSYGNYFSDLSESAQKKILGYNKFAFGKLDERASDQDVLNAFLFVNFTGVPMSKDHINFVKAIEL